METTLKDILTGYKSDKIWAGDYAYTGRLDGQDVEVYIQASVAVQEGRKGSWALVVYIDGVKRLTDSG